VRNSCKPLQDFIVEMLAKPDLQGESADARRSL